MAKEDGSSITRRHFIGIGVAGLGLTGGVVTLDKLGKYFREQEPETIKPIDIKNGEVVDYLCGPKLLLVASSMTEAFIDMARVFDAQGGTTENSCRTTDFSFKGSSGLVADLLGGTRGDLFVSADLKQMDLAASQLLVDRETVQLLAQNELVLVVPRGNPAEITSLEDLGRKKIRYVTTQDEVPIGAYALSLLDKASQDSKYGSDFMDRVMQQTISKEGDVRSTLAKVENGLAADAAIVYRTDASLAFKQGKVEVIELPHELYEQPGYYIAVLNHSLKGQAFKDFALSEEGQRILSAAGFIPTIDTSHKVN
jgi:molybdate transport system substrate-binding protein